jgi:hypothetical protein
LKGVPRRFQATDLTGYPQYSPGKSGACSLAGLKETAFWLLAIVGAAVLAYDVYRY